MARSLTKEMRTATREIHNISDSLVNAKLAFGEFFFTKYKVTLLIVVSFSLSKH